MRCEPNPRRPTVLAPCPPSDRKPRNALLICDVPEVIEALCKVSAVPLAPARTWSSRVTMVTGDGVLKLLRRRRDPVTTIAPWVTGWPLALVGTSAAGGSCSPSAVFCGVVSAGAVVTCAKAGVVASAAIETDEKINAVKRRMGVRPPHVVKLSEGFTGGWTGKNKTLSTGRQLNCKLM